MWSKLYEGNQHTVNCFQDAVLGAETALELDEARRSRIVIRSDGGAGSEANIRWLLTRGYQIHGKGLSNSRAGKLATQVERWDPYADVWLGAVDSPVDFGRPTSVFVLRRLKKEKFVHSYFVSTLKLPSKGALWHAYNKRGGAEVEQFRQDKSGLAIGIRQKRLFDAQEGYILMTDIAHNLLADFKHNGLQGSRFEAFGLKRIVRDLLHMSGQLTFEDGQLTKIALLSQNQYARDLLICLERYCFDGSSKVETASVCGKK